MRRADARAGAPPPRSGTGSGAVAGVRPDFVCVVAFAAGLTEAVTVQIFGRVHLVELVLPIAAVAVAATRSTRSLWRQSSFWTLILALLGLLVSYVVSDLVRDTSPDQYLRGWGRALFIVSDVIALSVLVAADRRALWWFVLGVGLSGILHARLIEHIPLRSHGGWKFSYAPHGLLTLSALAGLVKPRLAALAFAAFAVYAMTLEGRSVSLIATAVAGFLWFRGARDGRRRVTYLDYARLAAVVLVGALAVVALLEHTENPWTARRRAVSDENRFALLEIGARTIIGSPLLGYGSWSFHPEIAEISQDVLSESGGAGSQYYGSGSTLMHSQLLQAWVEGGIGGGVFFLFYAYLLLRAARRLAIDRAPDVLSAMLFYLCLNGVWHLFMSPLAATTRLDITMACAAVVALALERAAAARAARARPSPAGARPGSKGAGRRAGRTRPRSQWPGEIRANKWSSR